MKLTIPSGHQAVPHCIYAFHPYGAPRVVTTTSALLVGPKMKSSIVKDKKSTKCRDSVVHRHLLKFAQQGTSQSGKPPQGAGTPSKPRDAEYSITPKARPSGLTEQGASTGKPAEEDTTVQKLPTAKTKLSGTARRKLRKAKAGQSGTGSLTQPGHETLSLQWVLNDPDLGVTLPRNNLPRNPGLLWSLGRTRKLSSTLEWLYS